MFDEKDMDRTDALGQCFREIGGEMLPPPDLVKAAKAGVRLHRRVGTATHVRRFAGAVVLYAACVALLLGTIFLFPRLFDTSRPANTDAPTSPSLTDPLEKPKSEYNITAPLNYESIGTPTRGTLSELTEAQIKITYATQLDQIDANDVSVEFIANLDEKYAVFVDAKGLMHLAVVTTDTVCGLKFTYGDSNGMRIYCSGRLYTLPEAYQQGVLTQREVIALYVLYTNPDASMEIRQACAQRYSASENDFFVRFMKSGFRDGGKTVWHAIYVYGPIEVTNDITVETVNGLEFIYSSTRMMEIYYEGRFYSLSEAFEKDIISDWDLRFLYYDHIELRAQEPLTEPMKKEIEAAWQNSQGNVLRWYDNNGNIRYYGTFNDCVILFEDTEDSIPSQLRVKSHLFEHTSSFQIHVYQNGEFIDLNTAYQTGLLDSDTINTLSIFHDEFNK